MEQILTKALKQCEEAEVFQVRSREDPVVFEANQLKLIEHRETSGVALRLIRNGRIGFAATTDLHNLDRLIDNALEVSEFGPASKIEFPGYQTFSTVPIYDPDTENFPVDDMIQLGQKLIDGVRSSCPELLCDAGVSKTITDVSILNSRGGSSHYNHSSFSISIEGTLIRDTDMLFVGDGKNWCQPTTVIADLVKSVYEQVERSQQLATAPIGEVPVLFTPRGTASILLGPLLAGLNGRSVAQGTSPLMGKLGEPLLDKQLSIYDDPTFPYAPGSRQSDDEGIPTQKLSLIEQGTVKNFLLDLQAAAELNQKNTGSAQRGLSSPPTPGTSVLLIEKGSSHEHDMIASMDDGLIVERLLGAGQSNILGGDFLANVLLGYRVTKGKIVGRVKDTLIGGNVYKVLSNLDAVSNQPKWVGGFLRAPMLLCSGVSVATKT